MTRKSQTTYHEVTLDERELFGKAFFLGIPRGTLDLIIVVVQANNIRSGKFDNLSSGSANTTSNIKYLHSFLDAHDVGEVVLMSGDGLSEWLTIGKATKMERATPAVLVQIGGKIVVAWTNQWVDTTSGREHTASSR